MLAAAPFESSAQLLQAAERAFDQLTGGDWMQAFAAHAAIGAPRAEDEIGSSEQATVESDPQTRLTLAAANVEYQHRFGFVFLIRAHGRSGPEILAAMRARINNPPEVELANASREQREITALRLSRLVAA